MKEKEAPTARATFSSTAWTSSSSVGRPPAFSVGRKRTRDPGRSSERVISSGSSVAFKDSSQTNVDLGFKPPGLKWKGKDAMTGNQLQQLSKKKVQSKSKG
ncbi:hypothetical protein H5410_012613, partial [Solanum commersonii]